MSNLSDVLTKFKQDARQRKFRLAEFLSSLLTHTGWPDKTKDLLRPSISDAIKQPTPRGNGPTFDFAVFASLVGSRCAELGVAPTDATCEIAFNVCLQLPSTALDHFEPNDTAQMTDLLVIENVNRLLSQQAGITHEGKATGYSNPAIGIDLSLAIGGKDLAPAASQRNFDEAIDQVFECLLFGSKMPVLVGEPGVGKSTVARQIAWLLAKRDYLVPTPLLACRLITVSRSDLLAGANKRGRTEEIARALVNMADRRFSSDIVFIDELHSLFDNSKETAAIAQELKPAMARGELRLFGATTRREFDEFLSIDAAMLDRIQIVNLNPPTDEETIGIIQMASQQILGEAAQANIVFEEGAITHAVKLAKAQLPLEFQPRKSIDLLTSAVSRVWRDFDRKLKSNPLVPVPKVTSNDVAKALGRRLGIDADSFALDVDQRFNNIRDRLSATVFGHEKAIGEIVDVLKEQELGVYGESRPRGVFLLVGPSGIGKTHLAEQLCRSYFMQPDGADLRDRLSRIDLANMMGEMGAAAFKGSSAGYVGFRQTRTIYGDVRTSPNRLILLQNVDENPAIAPFVEEIATVGVANDGAGYPSNFRPAIIVMTCSAPQKNVDEFARIADCVVDMAMPSKLELGKVAYRNWQSRWSSNNELPKLSESECNQIASEVASPREAVAALEKRLSRKLRERKRAY